MYELESIVISGVNKQSMQKLTAADGCSMSHVLPPLTALINMEALFEPCHNPKHIDHDHQRCCFSMLNANSYLEEMP